MLTTFASFFSPAQVSIGNIFLDVLLRGFALLPFWFQQGLRALSWMLLEPQFFQHIHMEVTLARPRENFWRGALIEPAFEIQAHVLLRDFDVRRQGWQARCLAACGEHWAHGLFDTVRD